MCKYPAIIFSFCNLLQKIGKIPVIIVLALTMLHLLGSLLPPSDFFLIGYVT